MLTTVLLVIVVAIHGALLGNYMSSAYHRIPNNKPINGISKSAGIPPHCSACGHNLKMYEYYPILSWIFSRFKCNYCGVKIDPTYTVLEVSMMFTSIALYFWIGISYTFVFATVFIATLALALALYINYKKVFFKSALFVLVSGVAMTASILYTLPSGFVYLSDLAPEILQDVKYATNDNFMGRPARGYEKQKIILTAEAATALKKINADLMQRGYKLKVFDGYRPQSAVDHFWEWANDHQDMLMQQKFYPEYTDKTKLFDDGYIARLSKHSRGSTVDLTIVKAQNNEEVDMGCVFDLLGTPANFDYPNVSEVQKYNRYLLKEVMEKYGFSPYSKEWWHFELIDEPFPRKPEDHRNFVIR